jgi:O-antigen ligase
VRGTALGAFAICALGLTSRVLPHVLPTQANIANNRLSYPVTYWNALGLIAAIGAILAIGIASTDRESRAARSLAAASVPVFAATLLFTFSRGAMVALIVGLIVYLAVARQRGVVAALLAIVPTTAVAVVAAYGADQLATTTPTTPAAVAQGKDVALAVALCALAAAAARFLLAPLDRRLDRIHPEPHVRRRLLIASGSVAAVAIGVTLAAGGAGWVNDQFDRFLHGQPTVTSGDLRARLSDPSSNGRIDHWNAAFDGFAQNRLHGTGAGTYQFVWEEHRAIPVNVVDAHGLYFETLSDLGIVGLVLLVAVILGMLTALARRVRGPNRGFYAALFAAGVVWAVHAGIDWDWEMPAVTAWLFAVAGAALAAEARERPRHHGRSIRVPLAAALLVLAVTPVFTMLAQSHIANASDAFYGGDCDVAQREALDAIQRLATRPEPYEILGYCDMQQGRAQAAVTAMQRAVDKQPDSWEPRFGLALARAYGGSDPRADLAVASMLNPRESIVKDARGQFAKATSPEQRQAAASALRATLISSGRLALK